MSDLCETPFDRIYAAGGPVAMHKVTVAASTGAVLSRKTNYLHKDYLGSVEAITNEAGSVVTSYRYDPWGKQTLLSGDNNVTHHGYTGHEMSNNMGLVNMNGRFYDPTLARFIQADPTIQAPTDLQNFNRYSYVDNNPFAATDPSGYWKWKNVLKVVVAVAIVAATVAAVVACAGTCGVILAPALSAALTGEIAGGAIGAIAAKKNGGDVASGLLFGVVAGGITGAAGGAGGALVTQAASGLIGTSTIASGVTTVVAGATQGAVAGTGIGAASGYAGGAGDLGTILEGVKQGAIMGAAAGAVSGVAKLATASYSGTFQGAMNNVVTGKTSPTLAGVLGQFAGTAAKLALSTDLGRSAVISGLTAYGVAAKDRVAEQVKDQLDGKRVSGDLSFGPDFLPPDKIVKGPVGDF